MAQKKKKRKVSRHQKKKRKLSKIKKAKRELAAMVKEVDPANYAKLRHSKLFKKLGSTGSAYK